MFMSIKAMLGRRRTIFEFGKSVISSRSRYSSQKAIALSVNQSYFMESTSSLVTVAIGLVLFAMVASVVAEAWERWYEGKSERTHVVCRNLESVYEC